METSEQVLTADVLVVGAGIAGCFAAIRAKELGADVLLVEQGTSGFSGMSARGMHYLRVVLPEDDHDLVLEGTALESEYMIDQEFGEVVIRETYDRFQDLLKFGVGFRRDDSGQILWNFTDTHLVPFKQRCVAYEPMASHCHMLKIKKEAVRRGVKVLDRVLAVDLITSDGKVQGAFGVHKIDGSFYLFRAKAVVIATGDFVGSGQRYPQLTGDGMAMALRAGAELRSMELGKIEVGMRRIGGGPQLVHLIMNPPPEYRITNEKGEDFLEKYEDLKRIPGRKYFGPPWCLQFRAVLREWKEGRGPCYVDWRLPNLGSQLREFRGSAYDRILRQVEFTGVTLDKVKDELVIGITTDHGCGVRVNTNCESTLPGLCAAGTASDMGCAPAFVVPSGQIGSAVTGYRAGESAAKFALAQSKLDSIGAGKVSQFKSEVYAPMQRKRGVTADEIRMAIAEARVNLDIRNETRIKKAQEQLKKIEKDASELYAEDYHELVKCHKARNLLECNQASADAALMRTETRLMHVRDDYPMIDNKNWLKWVITRRVGDRLHTDVEDIPIERWKYKPERTLVDPLEPAKKEVSS